MTPCLGCSRGSRSGGPGTSIFLDELKKINEGAALMWEERIIVDPHILVGKPVIKGTRLAVEFVLDLLAQSWSRQEILRNYPGLEAADIQACLAYARDTLRNEKVFPLKAA